jgi:hypothetical protein
LIWSEAVAFFISKLINHKRASETLVDIRAELQLVGPTDQGAEALKLALDQRMSELIFLHQRRRRPSQVKARRRSSYFEAARILGGMMGERLYLAHRSRKIPMRTLLQWMRRDASARDFETDYEEIVQAIATRLGPEHDEGREKSSAIKTRKERL